MTRTAILGVGHYVPSKVVTNDDLSKLMNTSDEWIVQRSGIRERRYIEHDGIGASDLAVPAAQMACERAGCDVSEIDAILFATLSPDVNFPGSGVFLGHKLGLKGVPALDVRNQCSGFLYGLSVADAWIRTGMYRRVLLVGSEVHSTGLDFSDEGRDVTVLFGDGAGAALLGPTDDDDRGIHSVVLHADGVGATDLWVEAPASRSQPRLTDAMMAERRHYPKMQGKQVFRWATEKMPEVTHEALQKAGKTLADVDLFVPHQANLRINEFVARKLGLPWERVVNTIERYGNTTAATIPLSLSEAWGEGRAKAGQLVAFAAFGSGYTWGGAVVRL
ncbi:MAG: ketoacyl-ACP synthase III [Myxococcales bacterium]|nr:ketoacyl-ACP synthase III [Myxococcales bacterium]